MKNELAQDTTRLTKIALSFAVFAFVSMPVLAGNIILDWQMSKYPRHEGQFQEVFSAPYLTVEAKSDEAIYHWQLEGFKKLKADPDLLNLSNNFKITEKAPTPEEIYKWQMEEYPNLSKAYDQHDVTFKEYNNEKPATK